jgi:hypothetical protein
MPIIAKYPDDIQVEIEPTVEFEQRVSRGARGTIEVAENFSTGFAKVLPALQNVITQLQTVTPDQIEVECGIKMTGEAGAVIAKTGVEGNFRVTLKWDRTTDVTR